jgi:hypothetical protein
MRSPLVLVGLGAAAVVAQNTTYWWRYNNTDAENEDIRQLPCESPAYWR